ncbi:hypothetical protein CC1G_10130 [Coprinopsis cinerea okayama7|uniref:CxC2-like cysteine cluster KDZ transposase-associated domain-containing protein n=1 Tax=Coprinopsis cinerea (strain Okayama-7 / 130 / ATCC MYA-4618 / FGSC 9003) TaxID=240176 RepID=A8N3Z1_COPC7|nr:hypothetical protein CC1G_10130 [Coprinopsis cinerea okayama7\|eukprot:XP_001829600.2 hypothetical protein CC1G_10130 [Coprinopsis cinerea okayama7\
MRRSFGKRVDCEPADRVKTYKAKVKSTSSSTKGKLTLVPAHLKTPRAERDLLRQKSRESSRTKRIEHLLSTRDNEDGHTRTFDDGSFHDSGLFVPFDLPELVSGPTNRPNDYLREWKHNKKATYLEEVLARAATELERGCSSCGLECDTVWRCKDCFTKPVFCTRCCRDVHVKNPFHRVEVWKETHFVSSWLWRSGLTLELCQQNQCRRSGSTVNGGPSNDQQPSFTSPWAPFPDDDDASFGARPNWRVWDDCDLLVIVHTNGVHHLPTRFCSCDDAPQDDIQLLRHDLYPASHKDVRTVFTFAVLDEYLLQNLECYTSAYHFFSKLRRMTNEAFPKKVPDRYRELLRCSREWRRLKDLKRYGFGHREGEPQEGEMALFCPACPQAGKNVHKDWRNEPDQWRYSITLVADGNFTLVHRKQKGNDDVWLKSGDGYLVERIKYDQHLRVSTEMAQKSSCHEHRAVEDRSKIHKGCDVTGVGALACSRHGCFAPSSVVGFQKGERQINKDYGLMGAVRTTGASVAPRLNLLYDINCQYSIHLRERFANSSSLSLPEDLPIVFGIGKFHVFGHQEQCFARYSPAFIDGIGDTAGEILEPLWSNLNEASRSTQTMSLAHYTEVLDDHIADSNWKKLIHIVGKTSAGYEKAWNKFYEAEEAFKLLDAIASEAQRVQWRHQLDQALKKRLEGDVAAMDILTVRIDKPPTRAKVQHDLMVKEQRRNKHIGVTSWLSLGIKIQESQLTLKAFKRTLPRLDLRTELQNLELVRRREQLRNDITEFLETGAGLFPQVDFDEYSWVTPPQTNPEIEGDDEDSDSGMELDPENPFLEDDRDPEDADVPLPSSFSQLPVSMESAAQKEIQLRIAQANDALETVRTEIGHKSFLYRSNIRLADGKKQKTRGYAAVKSVNQNMRHHIRLYNQARWSLRRLGANTEILERYRDLKPEHTKAITAIYQPNAPGQSRTTLSWIWTIEELGGSETTPYLEELYRVNWLRALCRMDRWKEEVTLLKEEMGWICNFFKWKEESARGWAGLKPNFPGHRAYAHQQADMWKRLGAEGRESFRKALESADQTITRRNDPEGPLF